MKMPYMVLVLVAGIGLMFMSPTWLHFGEDEKMYVSPVSALMKGGPVFNIQEDREFTLDEKSLIESQIATAGIADWIWSDRAKFVMINEAWRKEMIKRRTVFVKIGEMDDDGWNTIKMYRYRGLDLVNKPEPRAWHRTNR